MAMEVNTNSTAWVSSDDVLNRYDSALICQLCMNAGVTPEASSLSSNTRMSTAIKAASGRFEAAVTVGKRFDISDIQALVTAGGNSCEYLKSLICTLAVAILWRSRPDREGKEPEAFALADEDIARLKSGEDILGFTEAQEAGNLSVTLDSPQTWDNRQTMVTRARRFFGTRVKDYDQIP